MRLLVPFQCHIGEVARLVGAEFAFEDSLGLVVIHSGGENRDEC